MDKSYEFTFERITVLIHLLSAYDPDEDLFGNSIRAIAKHTGSAAEQIRCDLICLNRNGFRLSPAETAKKLSPDESCYDEVIFSLAEVFPLTGDYSSPYLVFLNQTEQNLFSGGRSILFKDSPVSVPFEVHERIRLINRAIQEKKYIEFTYKSPSLPEAENIKAAPVMIYNNRSDDLWYCVVFPDNELVYTYRIDRIKPRSSGTDITILDEHFAGVSEEDIRFKKLSYMWGADFDNKSTDPVHVKIRISPNTANILKKIKADTFGRPYSRLYKQDSYWIYEDDIIGLGSFRSWLLLFGSSVKVLEPQELADKIIEEAEKCLDYYV